MPFYPPFLFPFYNNKPLSNHLNNSFHNNNIKEKNNYNACQNKISQKDSADTESTEALFELFGLKLYLDDILIICILLFLYSEKVKNEELYICLLLLLLT